MTAVEGARNRLFTRRECRPPHEAMSISGIAGNLEPIVSKDFTILTARIPGDASVLSNFRKRRALLGWHEILAFRRQPYTPARVSSSARWQRTRRPTPSSRSRGGSVRHTWVVNGHRGWK